jgi:hypothetical protein
MRHAYIVESNIFLSNNLRPGWWLAAASPLLICTELLLTGGPWNQSFVSRPYQSWGQVEQASCRCLWFVDLF